MVCLCIFNCGEYVNTGILSRVYQEFEAVRSICDHMANRPKNQSETMLHRMLTHLEQEGQDFRPREVIGAFRQLEEAECGKYVEGRHGWKSRFVWSVKSRLVAGVAQGLEGGEALEAEEEVDEFSDDDLVEHTYVLRPDLSVSFELPTDLTRHEAQRLSQFIDSLSFEE